jgi:hypothetical protein
MASIVDKSPVQVIESPTNPNPYGVPMMREFTGFLCYYEQEYLEVRYKEWLVTPTGERVNFIPEKKYIVKNTYKDNNMNGPLLTTNFNKWYAYLINSHLVGAWLGRDLIVSVIKAELAAFPFDIPDGYVLNPPQ